MTFRSGCSRLIPSYSDPPTRERHQQRQRDRDGRKVQEKKEIRILQEKQIQLHRATGAEGREREREKRVSKENSASPYDSMVAGAKTSRRGSREGRSASDSSQILFEGAPS